MFNESDWKLYKTNISKWQERYINKVNKEIEDILHEDKEPFYIFWKVNDLIESYKHNPGVLISNACRSNLYNIMASLLIDNVISKEDINEFSSDLKEYLNNSI